MKRLEFDCDFDLVEKIETLIANDSNPLISVYGKFNIIKTLLKDFIQYGFDIRNEIELEDYNVSYYDKEFVLYVNKDGINVEKTFVDDKYCYGGGDVSFVHEDCSSTLLKYIESDKIYEFGYNEEDANDNEACDDECYCDCCKSAQNPECPVKSDDNGYTISVKYNLDTSEAEKIIKDMEHRMEHMNDMFKEMDNFRRIFRW